LRLFLLLVWLRIVSRFCGTFGVFGHADRTPFNQCFWPSSGPELLRPHFDGCVPYTSGSPLENFYLVPSSARIAARMSLVLSFAVCVLPSFTQYCFFLIEPSFSVISFHFKDRPSSAFLAALL